ncbi:Hypothetical Protein FCC1311_106652 [Hondaea fermentalgiana]|uniref:Uncharacterized protein n=1 Tax=Hondaea fermentalgiana TaxID=2315210 RepID=A0A2R5H0Z0_9STRA|nr:Hypothetical Protein FCC1311_106652 [Hondaea fermentalgiana]|eukprot:GBG34441.1 Hypothetical Protein FCC1311_106652 [Hondaea fermentalgiana]
MSFFQRIAQFLANELITKRLAQSETFMRAAHKTHQNVTKSHKYINETTTKASSSAKEGSTNILGFLSEVRKELGKELGGGRK